MDRRSRVRAALLEAFGEPPSENVPLSALSSFGIGGPADLFLEVRTEGELMKAVALASGESYPFYLIGGGSNLLFDDAGYRGLIIRNRLEGLSREENRLNVLSGTGLADIMREALAAGLSGLEFLAGIPGTLGGAVYGNAGAYGWSVGDVVAWATVLIPGGERRTMSRASLGFGYRDSALKRYRGIVLRASLICSPGDSRRSEAKIREILEKRRTKHPPLGTACAGSYFKNSSSETGARIAAGQLLEQAGARGMAVGDAAVSAVHCNFIVNTGNARAADVLRLADELKERVFRMFGIRLEEEVIYLRADASMF
ncbi:MAG TPA: UDP-N-acetylmuramate dehydrogenase [Candidatus Aminicenantes bacterium]|nr:UDP-N-acetylmuramate dehydrogenase [Candidatus Aminicenantes bacterium]